MSCIFIYVVCTDGAEAGKIADALLEKHLIACANIMSPHTAVYRWQGKIETGQEVAVILKTREELFDKVEELVLELHSYDCPCIIALPVLKGHGPFLDWIGEQTGTRL